MILTQPPPVRRTSAQTYPCGLAAMFYGLWTHRQLLWQLTKRDVEGRYRGSFAGLLWSFFNPLIMLALYTLVFGVIMTGGKGDLSATGVTKFAIELFAGLIVFNFFSECVIRAPSLVLSNVNYVKKVVFPLEALSWTAVAAALFHACIGLLALSILYALVHFRLHWTLVFFPAVLIPVALFAAGFTFFLSALGVYVRDVSQAVAILNMLIMFLSPIFYPITGIPQALRPFFYLNPISFAVEQLRAVALRGEFPQWAGLGLYAAVSVVAAWAGYWWFQKTRKGFADVI
jgi:lipopolysaccharide transport system permease protein